MFLLQRADICIIVTSLAVVLKIKNVPFYMICMRWFLDMYLTC